MSDLLDEAEREREQHLLAALSRRKPGLPRIGHCHNCDTALRDGVFCDADCGHDYERRKMNGRL